MMHDDNSKKNHRLGLILQRSLEGNLTVEEKTWLGDTLRTDVRAREFYIGFMKVHSGLRMISAEILPETASKNNASLNDLLQGLSEYEQEAPEVIIPTELNPELELVIDTPSGIRIRKKSKWENLLLLGSIAAAGVMFPPAMNREVATITDMLSARWQNNGVRYETGTRLFKRERMLLEEGLAELEFDNGVRLTIESPASFKVRSDMQIDLEYGRLFATVPGRASGFTVKTRVAKVVDIGTRFGVEVDKAGAVSLHVIQGQTKLGLNRFWNNESIDVKGGAARNVSAREEITVITCDDRLFAQEIGSRSNTIWRGEEQLDLADVVCGGSGFNTGNAEMVIDPLTGELQPYVERGSITRRAQVAFSPAESMAYVDGVFVPDGGEGAIEITSTGIRYGRCPDTSGATRKDLTVLNKVYYNEGGDLILGDVKYGYPYRPAICMQANIGITFDLDAIRADLKNVEIEYFEALCAMASLAASRNDRVSPAGKADFIILLDGKEKKVISDVRMDFSEMVHIDIEPQDRFLTIMTTDHQLKGESDPIGWDRCFLGEPVLGLRVDNVSKE
ncbi:MAG: FecR domain-containing protein [Sedimentisphaerales bacterium]|nr:FecR domain-containing protein [Sedimentisphaerales bacterium]